MFRVCVLAAFSIFILGCSDSGPGPQLDSRLEKLDTGPDRGTPDLGADSGKADSAADRAPDGAGPGSFETAQSLTLGPNKVTGSILDPATSRAYFMIKGKKGQRLYIRTSTPCSGSTSTSACLDTNLTVYDSARTVLAEEDDPWPRVSPNARVFTQLPADGDYYVVVGECNSLFGPTACAPVAGIVQKTFSLWVEDLATYTIMPVALEGATDQDGTPANALAVAYGKSTALYLAGTLQTGADLDVWSFTVPAGTTVPPGQRSRADFYLQPAGTKLGHGSTATVKVWIADAAAPDTRIVELDQSNYGVMSGVTSANNSPASISLPVTLDKKYLLFVKSNNATGGARDFYFAEHRIAWILPVSQAEKADATNGTPSGAEPLTPYQGGGQFGVDGDITPAGTDVDHYSLVPPAGATQVTATCAAQRGGSGLRGFKASLLGADGTLIPGTGLTETATANMDLAPLPLPAGTTKVLLKLEAAAQDPNVTSSSYRCTVLFL